MKKPIHSSEPRLRNMVVLSGMIHCVVLALFFLIQGQRNSPLLNPLAHSMLVSVVNFNDLTGKGDSEALSPLTPETKKKVITKTPPLQKKPTVKQKPLTTINPKKLPVPPQENAGHSPFDSVNMEPVRFAIPALSDIGNNVDSPGNYEKSENLATGNREAFSHRDGSGERMGSGKNNRDSGSDAAGDAYLMMIRSKIEQHKIYPRQASIRQIQGTVVIHFIITLDGIIKGIDVVQSSGSSALDQAGLQAVKDASPFPKPPIEIFNAAVSIEVPIVFELI